jgi:hypothetical protein
VMATPLLIAAVMLGFAAMNPTLSGSKTSILCAIQQTMDRVTSPGVTRLTCHRDESEHEVLVGLHAKIVKDCAQTYADVERCAQQVRSVAAWQANPGHQFWSNDVEHYARFGFLVALPLALLVIILPLRALYRLIATKKRQSLELCERRISEVEGELEGYLAEGKLDLVKGARDRLEALRVDWRDCGSATWVMSRTSILGILIAQVPTLIGVVTTAATAWLSN